MSNARSELDMTLLLKPVTSSDNPSKIRSYFGFSVPCWSCPHKPGRNGLG